MGGAGWRKDKVGSPAAPPQLPACIAPGPAAPSRGAYHPIEMSPPRDSRCLTAKTRDTGPNQSWGSAWGGESPDCRCCTCWGDSGGKPVSETAPLCPHRPTSAPALCSPSSRCRRGRHSCEGSAVSAAPPTYVGLEGREPGRGWGVGWRSGESRAFRKGGVPKVAHTLTLQLTPVCGSARPGTGPSTRAGSG